MKHIKALSFLLAVTLLFALTGCSTADTVEPDTEELSTVLTWQEQYDLGMKYLSEGNYEEAIIAFTAAIEIDPKATASLIGRGEAYIGSGETEENLAAALADYQTVLTLDEAEVLAYLGIADVYIRMGEYDLAMEILQQGLLATDGDSAIADKLAEIESGTIVDSSNKVRKSVTYSYETGEIQSFTEYFYNEKGLRYTWNNWSYEDDEDGNRSDTPVLDNYCLVTYDENDLIEAYHFYDENDELTFWDSFVYNDQGLKIEQYRYSTDEEVDGTYFLFYYNDAGQETKYERYYNGELDGYWISEYDDDGNFIQEVQYNEDGTIYSYSVEQ